jgi:hypothetical protein
MSLLLLFNQRTLYSKDFTDSIIMNDILVKDMQFTKADNMSLIDSIIKSYSLPTSDSIALGDIIDVGDILMKQLMDSLSISDTLVSKDVVKSLLNIYITSDEISKLISQSKQDNLSITDLVQKSISKPIIDTITLIDALIKDCHISQSDALVFLDVINTSAGIVRSFSDSVSLSDYIIKELQLKLSAEITLVDTREFASEHLSVLNYILGDGLITVLMSKVDEITTTILVNSGIYQPAYLPVTNYWAQSKLTTSVSVNSNITVTLVYSSKIKGYHG